MSDSQILEVYLNAPVSRHMVLVKFGRTHALFYGKIILENLPWSVKRDGSRVSPYNDGMASRIVKIALIDGYQELIF